MSTIEDFENAPVGATATRADGLRAMKMDDVERLWAIPNGLYADDDELAYWDFTLDPIEPAPVTANEALDLAWELAHPVKEGRHIPRGVRLLDRLDRNEFSVYTTLVGFTISARESLNIRTLDPLPNPEPEPDWLDALVVLARHVKEEPDSPPSLWANLGDGMWGHVETTKRATVRELRDVTPLYPKGDE